MQNVQFLNIEEIKQNKICLPIELGALNENNFEKVILLLPLQGYNQETVKLSEFHGTHKAPGIKASIFCMLGTFYSTESPWIFLMGLSWTSEGHMATLVLEVTFELAELKLEVTEPSSWTKK